jgi:hypothetical protein
MYRWFTEPDYTTPSQYDTCFWELPRSVLKYATLGAQLAVIFVLALATRASLSRDLNQQDLPYRRYGEVSLIVCGMLLLSPMSSKTHFCVLLLPVTFCLWQLIYYHWSALVASMMAIVFIAGTGLSKGILGRELGNHILSFGTCTISALACLIATSYLLCRSSNLTAQK